MMKSLGDEIFFEDSCPWIGYFARPILRPYRDRPLFRYRREKTQSGAICIVDSGNCRIDAALMEDALESLRRFNRFFTQFVGALDNDFLGTQMTLAEARLLFEIANRESPRAADLQSALDMDPGFVSRVLRRFEGRGWIARPRSIKDARSRPITLTEAGHDTFTQMDERQRTEVERRLAPLDDRRRVRLVHALKAAESLLQGGVGPRFSLRTFRIGDMGLIASRQAILYHSHYGWNAGIEINEGEVTTAFVRDFKAGREQCWVAELNGEIAGSIFLTDEGGGVSRLRLLYVEPHAQGLGVGVSLVKTCLSFAREVGYDRVTLWTHSILESARRIYEKEGFRLVATQEHDTFGPNLLGETWELELKPRSAATLELAQAREP